MSGLGARGASVGRHARSALQAATEEGRPGRACPAPHPRATLPPCVRSLAKGLRVSWKSGKAALKFTVVSSECRRKLPREGERRDAEFGRTRAAGAAQSIRPSPLAEQRH
ncbi:unnamed protein product, partial [Brenthis ino]